MPSYLTDIHRFRWFIFGSVKREFAARYRNSMLGMVWLVLQPLAQILVYTLVFANLMGSRVPGLNSHFGYSIFLCAGILTWGLFAEIIARSQSMFLDHANLLKKLSFPRIVLPIIVLLSTCGGFLIAFGLFLVFLLLTGHFPGSALLAMPVVLAVQLSFAIGLGINLGVLNVFFRDVGQLFTIVLQFWFWLTPIVYPLHTLSGWPQTLIQLNPMTPLILAYQDILLRGTLPQWHTLAPTLGLGLLLCCGGLVLLDHKAGDMVDEL